MRKILIVDDDAVALSIVKTLLEKDYEVATAKSGLQALGYLQKNNDTDLILLDTVMPSGNGMDILKTLKKTPELKDIPVIFMTSKEGVAFEIEAISNGSGDVAKKPLNGDLLKLKIERQFHIVDLKRENRLFHEKLVKIQLQVNKMVEEAIKGTK